MSLTSVTEIDFRTYVAQARMFLEGERRYYALDPPGGSGPCVYPAGHLYIFAVLDRWTDSGAYLLPAQLAFGGLYLATSLVVSRIYDMVGAPPVLFLFLVLSKRLHSIYMLRMFNDPVAMLAMYICMYLLCCRKWSAACFAYSRIALSVKMNVLLYLPGLMVVLFRAWGAWRTVVSLVIIVGGTQGLLGLPFLLHDPFAYLKGSFDFSRVFLYEWTVNWRFLDEKTFLSASFSHLLLSLHLLLLLLFGLCQWTGISRQGWRWISLRWCGDSVPMSPFCKSRV
ncbi:Alpha-1,3-mannosyltransferase-like protein [Malassezia sympodialis ATCC 42132]|uniref:Alpha-1,3-mannosyltransferase-like protein n=1 Tax=Malassezia sympodialis (strain ATCC 42132) TaxID=1230383 RepID=UPI0002C29939|nr:Alpha-1,3-mannosyltransferase-like protein [Malassezia sympodialis ATCC 42132]CCV00314.1 Alpha-1,3-mannosyltransferase-like protein [Malassezia sympodialis ATCC 42132]|eukprot:XP_018741518.1 Alpha-1,3-mannosyltransferase-like protein [Malassezia sympodialis ATCC 42132]